MGKVLIEISDEDLDFLKTHYLRDNKTGEIDTTDKKFIEPIRNGIVLSNEFSLVTEQYEARLKADMVATLEEIKEQLREKHDDLFELEDFAKADGVSDSIAVIKKKINELKGK